MLFPSKVPIKKISCGEDFVIILTKDGKVYFHYQSAFYAANDKVFKNNPVIDIGTDDGIMIFIA
jgi:alpha-tubulin suppressor-like RCC1 family protein